MLPSLAIRLSVCLLFWSPWNLGDAGDLGSRDSQTLLHTGINWEILEHFSAWTRPHTTDIEFHGLGPWHDPL